MSENLRDPLFLFFVVGLTGGLLKSDLKLPDAIYQLLSTYLLLAIGIKGGVALREAGIGEVVVPAGAAILLGVAIPIAAFLEIGRAHV